MSAPTAIFGAGVMGETLLSGLLRSGRVRRPTSSSPAARPNGPTELAERYGVRALSNAEAADGADTLVLCVKPQDMDGLLDEIARPRRARQHRRLARRRHHHRAPRGAAARGHRGRARHAQHAGARRPGHGRDLARAGTATTSTWPRPRRCCARAARWCGCAEKHLDAVTAISGSGPAYIFYVVEAMIEAGVRPRSAAGDVDRARRPDARTAPRRCSGDRASTPPSCASRSARRRHDDRRAAAARRPQGAGRLRHCHRGRGRALQAAGLRSG